LIFPNKSSEAPRGRILIVDDHGIVRDGIAMLLERAGYIVAGTAATGKQAIFEAGRLKPDVIIMDLVLPDINGIDATAHILGELPLTRIVILSASRTSEHVYRALRAGARGYVIKDAAAAELAEAVATVLAGRQFLSPRTIAFDVDQAHYTSAALSPIESLSARERQVLHGICGGATSAEVARQLCLSAKTVDTYRGRLMAKLGVPNRTALIRFAIEHSLLPF
jgi:DNA-binding NarL/FixJ family response regulator